MTDATRTAGIVLTGLLLAGGCSIAPKGGLPVDGALPLADHLALLAERTAATRSFQSEGTVLVRTEREKHFLHFTAAWRRPDRSRLDLDLKGPLGFGSGRLTVTRSGETVEMLRPGEEVLERGTLDDPRLDPLAGHGLRPSAAPFLIAPYAGEKELYREERVMDYRYDDRAEAYRLVFGREGGGREVLHLAEEEGRTRLAARRMVERDGEVSLVILYRYGDDSDLLPKEVEARLPGEETTLVLRFRECVLNRLLPDRLFRIDGE